MPNGFNVNLTDINLSDFAGALDLLFGRIVVTEWEPVVPGQPLRLVYEFRVPPGESYSFTSMRTELSYERSNLFTEVFPYPAGTRTIRRGPFLIVPSPSDANSLWRIGDKTLTLTLSGLGPGGETLRVFSINLVLSVVGEPVDSSWWTWTWPPAFYNRHPWKRDYRIAGNFHNRSSYSRMSAHCDLMEEASSDHLASMIKDSIDVTASTRGAASVAFGDIRKDWQWIIPRVWFFLGPDPKAFVYRISCRVEDNYGNPYEFVTEERWVSVSVSEGKVLFGVAAMMGATVAAGLAISAALAAAGWVTAFAAPILAGAAAIAYSAAEVAGQQAQDPPEVDENYAELVSLESFRSIDIKFEGLPSINRFFGQAIKACELLNVLSTIHGKILGAYLGQDESAAYQQRMSFRQGMEILEQLAVRVQEGVPPAQKEFAEIFADPKFVEVGKSWTDKGVPPEIEKMIMNDFDEQPAMVILAKFVAGRPELLAQLRAGEVTTYFAKAIMHAVMSIRGDAVELLTPIK